MSMRTTMQMLRRIRGPSGSRACCGIRHRRRPTVGMDEAHVASTLAGLGRIPCRAMRPRLGGKERCPLCSCGHVDALHAHEPGGRFRRAVDSDVELDGLLDPGEEPILGSRLGVAAEQVGDRRDEPAFLVALDDHAEGGHVSQPAVLGASWLRGGDRGFAQGVERTGAVPWIGGIVRFAKPLGKGQTTVSHEGHNVWSYSRSLTMSASAHSGSCWPPREAKCLRT
jgi:hypothetical protein